MFEKTIQIGEVIVNITITEKPFKVFGDKYYFGFPINLEENAEYSCFENEANDLKGYWAIFDFSGNDLTIINDVLGGYRIYYLQDGNNIQISDDFRILTKNHSHVEVNTFEALYWKKHGYTTSCNTLFKNLNKLPPASITTVKNSVLVHNFYFKDLERIPNRNSHVLKVSQDLQSTFSSIKKANTPVVVLFSGGKDSFLLVKYLIDFEIEFTPVFFKINPISVFGLQDLDKVRKGAEILNIDVEEIQLDLKSIPNKRLQQIVGKQFFDRHFSLLHYLGYSEIRKRFGKNIVVINGQSSDSIFSFGPSEDSLMSYFRRQMLYKPKSFVASLGLFLLQMKARKFFKMPYSEEGRLLALFDEYKYSRALELFPPKNYYDYLLKQIKDITLNLSSYYSKEMFIKINSFSQGSDNQVVINASKEAEVYTIMPFATPAIIYATIENKDENDEIKEPKYVVNDILDSININRDMPSEKFRINKKDDDIEIDKEGVFAKKMEQYFTDYFMEVFKYKL
ncbi:asparagine synthetase B family protein [Sediminicola luteus]|uniref:asparagine synthase (glutamine-hydrolyzing) n=1 Tax=Sediminicola luteus TaxID=319238 RepID=A0A2A4GEX3_9FLAO|nr:hypothetical protein [Sediminicola luteus]PCE66554.1 hypothetical protein B7P33_04460 [Sediminicola luteus]